MGIEIERKYVIELPPLDAMRATEGYTCSEITQIYVEDDPSVTHRVRRRAYPDRVVYTETVKRRIDAISSVEDESEIGEEEYALLAARMKRGTHPVIKTRHTFPYRGRTVEVDVYPEWSRSCILEVELDDPSAEVELPPFIRILREVTGEWEYKNAAMAHSFPEELI